MRFDRHNDLRVNARSAYRLFGALLFFLILEMPRICVGDRDQRLIIPCDDHTGLFSEVAAA